MMVKNKTIIKFISSVLIIAIIAPSILLSRPKQVKAFWGATWLTDIFTGGTLGTTGASAVAEGTQTAFTIKNFAKEILKQIVMAVQRRLLATMTKSMVNWINSGFHGAPLFLENPKSFFQDITKYEVKTLIDTFGYDSRRFPFGRDFGLNTINSYKRQLEDNTQYTLSRAITDPVLLNNYRNNFNYGGWNGFLINTQYQQNNYIGFQMLATEELARRLEDTASNNAQKVRDTLAQGSGFLSPQTCADNGGNNEYNKTVANQFRRPSFKSTLKWDGPTISLECEGGAEVEECDEAGCRDKCAVELEEYNAYNEEYNDKKDDERFDWEQKNTCTRLVNTTPGSVVGNQIITAMGSNFRQTELGAALGSSLSAIFDALLNQFLSKGLNALASKSNPKPPTDDWDYYGNTLGSPTDGVNTAWDAGPDEPIILDDFKKQLDGKTIVTVTDATTGAVTTIEEIGNTGKGPYIPGDIVNTQMELALMDGMDPNNPYTNLSNTFPPGCTSNSGFSATTGLPCNTLNTPGITQLISQTWPKIRELDMCLPGPNIGWQDRLLKEMERNSKKLQEKANDSDGEKAAAADLVLKELKFAVNSFRDWINNKMILELPSSVTYMDAVDEIEDLYQQSEELTDMKRAKTQVLARLGAIKISLDPIVTQPAPGSAQEKTLIALKKQYNAVKASISSSASVEDARNGLSVSTEKLAKLNSSITQCNTQRTVRKWSVPGGATSTFADVDSYGISGTEQNMFCNAPIKGGYSHETFVNITGVTHLDIPLVNAKKVYTWRSWLGLKGNQVNIDLKCDIIYKATLVDYKKDLPGLNSGIVELPPGAGDVAQFGTCTYVETSLTQEECTISGGSWDLVDETCTRKELGITQDNCTANRGTWEP